jgi:hypothetical protein
LEKALQQAAGVIVLDSGLYSSNISSLGTNVVGDGNVVISNSAIGGVHNITVVNSVLGNNSKKDSKFYYCSGQGVTRGGVIENNLFVECTGGSGIVSGSSYRNNILIRCEVDMPMSNTNYIYANNVLINCQNSTMRILGIRPTGSILDYSIIIGTVKTSTPINGKTTGVTVEDFKADGNYFIKSYSEVDLFSNASGSGASVSQLNQIFNNFYYPYIDDYHNLDLTLRPNCDERVRFGGLNGTYIGALPVGYRLSASELWNTHIDTVNTSNLAFDMVNNAIVLATGQDVGTYTSLIIDLGAPITVDMVDFLANFVYNIEGTAKQGVSNQRIDTTPDLLPDNTKNQRVVYDYRLQYSPDGVTALTGWENLELNRMPTVDGAGLHQLDDGFNQATAQKITIQRLKIEFTLRRIIIA